jgi:hypothetical protein
MDEILSFSFIAQILFMTSSILGAELVREDPATDKCVCIKNAI